MWILSASLPRQPQHAVMIKNQQDQGQCRKTEPGRHREGDDQVRYCPELPTNDSRIWYMRRAAMTTAMMARNVITDSLHVFTDPSS